MLRMMTGSLLKFDIGLLGAVMYEVVIGTRGGYLQVPRRELFQDTLAGPNYLLGLKDERTSISFNLRPYPKGPGAVYPMRDVFCSGHQLQVNLIDYLNRG